MTNKEPSTPQSTLDPFSNVREDFEMIGAPVRSIAGKGFKLIGVERDPDDINYYMVHTDVGSVRLHKATCNRIRQLWLAKKRNFRLDVTEREGQAPTIKVVPLD